MTFEALGGIVMLGRWSKPEIVCINSMCPAVIRELSLLTSGHEVLASHLGCSLENRALISVLGGGCPPMLPVVTMTFLRAGAV